METINEDKDENKEKRISKTIFVFNLEEPTRTKWHRHYAVRCKLCNTFLVVACDSIGLGKYECLGDPLYISLVKKESYKMSRFPNHLGNKFKEFKWNDCNEHFTK